MPNMTIIPAGKTISISKDKRVMTALKEAGFYVKSSCGGKASCGDCVIKVIDGDNTLVPMEFAEIKLLGNVYHITKERLSCQTFVSGDITVDISAHVESNDEATREKKTKVIRRKKITPTEKEEESKVVEKEGGLRRPKRPRRG